MGFLHICKSAKEDGVFSNIFKKKSTKLLSDAGGTSYEYKWEKNILLVFIRTFCTFSAIIVIGNLDPASLTNYEIFISCTL